METKRCRSLVSVLLVAVWLINACGSMNIQDPKQKNDSSEFVTEDRGGGTAPILHLPFPQSTKWLCTQGPHQKFSHAGKSTQYDLDFDTSNSVSEEIYAPVSGKVYVFSAILTGSPFGNHVHIELSDGTFVVIAHLKEISVCDGCEIAVGQLIGLEGCTGSCTGDHVHIGLHQGDASNPAEDSVSIPVSYLVGTGNGESKTLSSEDFVCGIGGKEILGQSYESVLPSVMSHPDGTLVMSFHNPKVFLLEDGQRRWITNEQVFWSHGYDFANVVMVSDEELDCYPEGPMISSTGFVGAVTDPNGVMWLVVGYQTDPDRYRIRLNQFARQDVLFSWGLTSSQVNAVPAVEWSHSYLTIWQAKDGTAQFRTGTLIRENSSPAVYVTAENMAMPMKDWNTFLAFGFLPDQILWVEDGAILMIQKQVGDCQNAYQCVDMTVVSTCADESLDSSTGGQGGTLNPEVDQSEPEPEPNPVVVSSPDPDPDPEVITDPEPDPDPVSEPEPQPQPDPVPEPTPETELDPEPTPEPDPEPNLEPEPEPDPEPEPTPDPEPDPVPEPQPDPNPITDALCSNGELACVRDLDLDGIAESLLLADDLWIAKSVVGVPAYVYSNGGCFDGTLDQKDLVTSTSGYYVIDFSQFALDCASQITLISSKSMNGASLSPNMSNWVWWQGAKFCAAGSSLCHLMDNGTSWEEWLLFVSWDPVFGLVPNGNGFTSNTQL